MPTLPDFTSLGQAPGIRPSGGPSVASNQDFSGVVSGNRNLTSQQINMAEDSARAGDAIGRGISKVGEAGLILAKDNYAEDVRLASARAEAAWVSSRVDRIGKYKEDEDWNTAPDRYKTESAGVISSIAETYIQDPKTRELWTLKAANDVASDYGSLREHGNRRTASYNSFSGFESLDNLAQTFAAAGSDGEMKGQVSNAANNLIQDQLRTGAWTPEQARAAAIRFADMAYKTDLAQKDPVTRMSLLGGFERALIHREDASGNPATQNKLGFSGLYQFGAPRLETLGVYRAGTNENLKTWNKTLMASDSAKWSGSFDIPGFPGVKTINDFLRSPEAQKKVFDMHIAEIDEQILKNGLDRYIGREVQGVQITKEGIEAMAHLGGIGGATAVLEGKYWPPDANGTTLIEYAKLGLGGKSGDVVSALMQPGDREKMFDDAATQKFKQDRAAELQLKEQVQGAAGNYLSRIMNNQVNNILDDIKNDPVLLKDPQTQWQVTQIAERELLSAEKGEAKTYGAGYFDARQQVLDGTIKTYSEALQLAVDKKLTTQGLHEISTMIQNVSKTPDASAIERVKQSMLTYGKRQLSYEDPSMPFLKDPKGEDIFTTQFVPMLEFGYRDWVESGKNPRDYFDKSNIDKMIKGLRSPVEMAQNRLAAVSNLDDNLRPRQAGSALPPPPAGIETSAWTSLVSAPPPAPNGNPIAPAAWGKILEMLTANPSQATKDAFTKRFGPRLGGKTADDILKQLGVMTNGG